MKAKELIREPSVLRSSDSSAEINHSFQPLAALVCCQPAGTDLRPGAVCEGRGKAQLLGHRQRGGGFGSIRSLQKP